MVFPLCKLSFRYGQEDWPDSELVGVGGRGWGLQMGIFKAPHMKIYENGVRECAFWAP